VTARQNLLLAALPASDLERLMPDLKLVSLSSGQPLYQSDAPFRHVYFPIDSIVSLLNVAQDGVSTEMAIVGNEGVLGVSMLTGGGARSNRAVVLSGGNAYRLNGMLLQAEFHRAGRMQHLLLRYMQSLLTQIAQTVVCNRFHCLDQQLCRWLLMSLDRLPSNDFVVTQEFIASILGVRRESVNEAANHLKQAGLIQCSRGHIMVINRLGIETRACECYGAVKHELDRLLIH